MTCGSDALRNSMDGYRIGNERSRFVEWRMELAKSARDAEDAEG